MERLSASQLSERSGVDAAMVRRLVELGILHEGDDPQAPFSAGDLRRTRLVAACAHAGLPLEGIGKAIAAGSLNLSTMDLSQYERWEGYSDTTWGELAARFGVELGLLQQMVEALGFAPPQSDERARETDLELLPVMQLAFAFGIGERTAIRMMRVYGDSFRRIAEAEARLYHTMIDEPLLRAGLDQAAVLQAGAVFGEQVMPLLDRATTAMYRRQQERAWMEDLIEHVESALEDIGEHQRLRRPPAMCFLDLAGYTRITEERGDEVAAELAGELAGIVARTARDHGGQAVKWLGDGVMFHFKEPRRAVRAALRMVRDTPEAGLPPAHVGIHAGPIVFQDGDYFGRTVNLASRVAGRAQAGQVLVTESVVADSEPDADLVFSSIGAAQLKGVAAPVDLFEAAQL